MNRIAEMKAWKLFFFVFILPLFLEFSSIFYMPRIIGHDSMGLYGKLLPILTLTIITFFYLWLFLSALVINKIILKEIKPKLILFKISLLYSLLSVYVAKIIEYNFILSNKNIQYLDGYLFPVKLIALICFIYCILFVAKNLVTAESNKVIRIKKYISSALLMAMFPVGLWTIQPRIINVIKRENGNLS